MTAVTRAAVPKLGDWCSLVFLPEPGADPLVEVAHSDPAKVDWAKALQQQYPYDPDGPTGVPAVVRTGVTEFVPVVDEAVVNAALDRTTAISREEALAILDALQLSSVITVPLLTRRGVVGALQVVNAESGRHYSERDVTLAEAAAGSIAVGLEGAWRADQQREVAVSLQSALLPPALPEIGGMTIASRYWPSGTVTEAGGDFYDVFEMDDHIWAVVIGDVCGTGPDAAGVTAIARHTIRAAACHGAPHGEVLEWANDAIHAGRRDRFCTAVYSTVERLNAGGWRYESVSGGHPLPLIARADGSTTTLGRAGDLLGVWPKIKTTLAGCEIGAGDAIVVYTDGLTDLRPPYDLDTAAMVELVTAAAAASTTAEQIADHLTAALDAVLPIAERSDDMALLVLRAD